MNTTFSEVYVELEDTLVLKNTTATALSIEVNTRLVKVLYACVNLGKPIKLLTSTKLDPYAVLRKVRLLELFEEIVHLNSRESRTKQDCVCEGSLVIDFTYGSGADGSGFNKSLCFFDMSSLESFFENLPHGSALEIPLWSEPPNPHGVGAEALNTDYGDFKLRDVLREPQTTGVPVSKLDRELFVRCRQRICHFLQYSCEKYVEGNGLLLDISPQDHAGAKPWLADKPGVVYKTLGLDHGDFIGDITRYNEAIPAESVSWLVCCEVLEHTLAPWHATTECHRMLRSGGILLVSVPCNFRIHGPLPDSWRFTQHGLYHLLSKGSSRTELDPPLFEILEMCAMETPNRNLWPCHYTVVARKVG
ncbi:hypothetical protein RI054_16g75900 [Pseudoscourfieldia marina]